MEGINLSEELKERRAKQVAYVNKIKAITDEVMQVLHRNGLSVNDVNNVIDSIRERLGDEAHL